MPAYIPPALRGIAGQQVEGQARLCERIWRVTLEYTSGGPFDVAECPETLSEVVESDHTPGVAARHFEVPSDAGTAELRALLSWFSKASAIPSEQHPQGDTRCQLLFPPSLSKDARKHIHQLAQTLRLPTFSRGLGEERLLMVHGVAFRGTPEMEVEVAAVAARKRAPVAVRDRARQIWRWCQADGVALWSLSLGELEESLLAAPDEDALPTVVKDLLERREHGTALIAAIRAGDTPAALAVLDAHPRAAWIRDDGPTHTPAASAAGGGAAPAAAAGTDSGPAYYPLHLAALAGLGEVVDQLAVQPGAVEQRDRNYATPLKVAKKAGQAAMVEILLRHGAKDYEINQAAHKTAAVGIPVPPPTAGSSRRVPSNHGDSPHVGSPSNTSSPHNTSGSLGSSYMATHASSRQRRTSSEGLGGGGGSGRGPLSSHGPHHGHGPSSLGPGQHRGAHSTGRRSIDETPPPNVQHQQQHPHLAQAPAAGGTAPNDHTLNPFAILAAGDKSGTSSRRSSAGGLPPRPPSAEGPCASDSDSSTGAIGRGHGSRPAGRARASQGRCQLPPIQSGEISEESIAAALASMKTSTKPGLATATEGSEEASGAAGSDDEDGGEAAGGDEIPKKKKTRRGRRGRGSRRQSSTTGDEAITTAEATTAVAAGEVSSTPTQLLPHNRAIGPASAGADSSDRSAVTDGSESDGSGGDAKTCRGGQPARTRRHQRRRAARVSGADGGSGDRAGGSNGRRGSGVEYSSFHQGHGRTGSGGGGATGGHYHLHGTAHHGHADDAGSWRRDPAASPAPAGPSPGAAVAAPASPMLLRGGPDEPRQTAVGRPPAPRRMSACSGAMMHTASAVAVGASPTPGAASGAPPEAPGSPYNAGGPHGPREHVAAGPATGVGFGFGRGRGRGIPIATPGAPGSGVPSAPGSPLRPPFSTSGSSTQPAAIGSASSPAAPGASRGSPAGVSS